MPHKINIQGIDTNNKIEVGNIYKRKERFYILALLPYDLYVLINLNTGGRWHTPVPCISDVFHHDIEFELVQPNTVLEITVL